MLKKKLYYEARADLEKKYPGKLNIIGRSASQVDWWNHLRTQMSKMRSKSTKKSPVTKEQVRAAIEAAAASWKQRVETLAAKA